jgi:hypothetical protein
MPGCVGAEYFGTQVDPKRESHVQSEINLLDDAVNSCADLVRSFEERLAGVLIEPSPSDEKAQDENSLVPLGTEIRGIRRRLNLAVGHLRDILDRLEL